MNDVFNYLCSRKGVSTDMESLVSILNDYFENTPKDILDKDWEELKIMNNFGSDISDYVSVVFTAFNLKGYTDDVFSNLEDVYHTENVQYYQAA